MVEDGDMRAILSSRNLHADIDPYGALSLRPAVSLAGTIEDSPIDTLFPRHPQKQAAVVVLADGDVGLREGTPAEVEHILAILHLHGPDLGFNQLGFTLGVQHLVHGLPFYRGASLDKNLGRDPAPVVAAGMMEIVPAVNPGKTPIESCLVLVMTRTVLCQHTLSIRRHDRMEVWPEIRLGNLGKDRLLLSLSKNRDRISRPCLSHLKLSGQQGGSYG